MLARIGARRRGCPSCLLQEAVAGLPNFDPKRVSERLAARTARHTHIALRAGGRGHEQVRLGEEFEVVAHFDGRWLSEVLMRVFGEAGAHEHVEYVMNIHLAEAIAQRLAGEVAICAAGGRTRVVGSRAATLMVQAGDCVRQQSFLILPVRRWLVYGSQRVPITSWTPAPSSSNPYAIVSSTIVARGRM